jgi:iron-sulfur cluster assembly accessory protein
MAEPILTLSKKAIAHIQKTIVARGSGMGFRLAVKQTGCSGYMYVPEIIDEPVVGDIEIKSNESFKLYVDPQAVPIIQGTYVDFVTKSMGMEQLEYDNPNADSLCGCGESFNLK